MDRTSPRFRPVLHFRDGSSRPPVQAKQPHYPTVAVAASILHRAIAETQVGLLTGATVIDCSQRGAGQGIVLRLEVPRG